MNLLKKVVRFEEYTRVIYFDENNIEHIKRIVRAKRRCSETLYTSEPLNYTWFSEHIFEKLKG